VTPAQAKKQRAELMKQIAAAEKLKGKALMAELERQLAMARVLRKGKLALAKRQCVADRRSLRARVRERKARLLAELAVTAAAERLAAREACDAGIASARALIDNAARARAEVKAQRDYRAEMRRLERHARERKKEIRRPRTSAERRAESDDEVRQNIPKELHALFDRVKRGIKGSDLKSRTEAFFQYAEENPGEILASIDDETDALIAELEARQRGGK